METIKSPCTLQAIYQWIMANPLPSKLSGDRSLRLSAIEMIKASGMKTEWNNQDPQPGPAEVMSLYFLLEKASRKRGKTRSIDEIGSSLNVCLKLFGLPAIGREGIVVDLESLTFNLDDNVKVVDKSSKEKRK